MKPVQFFLAVGMTVILCSCFSRQQPIQAQGAAFEERTPLGRIALTESSTPVHPGRPGEVPFWNEAAVSFIYAPAFDYKTINGAVSYRYKIVSLVGNKSFAFEQKAPYESLAPVWADLPTGSFSLTVVGLSASGDSLGLAGRGEYYRAAPFNGVYHAPALPYDESAALALDKLLNKDYVQYWLQHQQPDSSYVNYCYPAKIYSALVVGAITYARLKKGTPAATKAVALARVVADFMLRIRYEAGSAWEYFVPTYYGKQYAPGAHVNPLNNFTIMGADAGNAFLDLYDETADPKYLEAAKRIAQTYLKNQMENGSWYQFTNYKTNQPVAPNISIPTAVLNFFDRLSAAYNVYGLQAATKRAFDYIMNNPVKTYNWQAQFEDVKANLPYKNLSREQACDFASYLLRNSRGNKQFIAIADGLIRFSEDQFVVWEKPRPKKPQNDGPGWIPANWITPSVQEQYVFWNPVSRSAGVMIQTYLDAYTATRKEMYLAKAKSIANALTLAQQAHNGDYPSFFTKYTMPLWLNSTVYPARVLMNLQKTISTQLH